MFGIGINLHLFIVDIEMGFVPDDCEHLDDYLFKYSH